MIRHLPIKVGAAVFGGCFGAGSAFGDVPAFGASPGAPLLMRIANPPVSTMATHPIAMAMVFHLVKDMEWRTLSANWCAVGPDPRAALRTPPTASAESAVAPTPARLSPWR